MIFKGKESVHVVPNLFPELVCVGEVIGSDGKVEDVFFMPIIAWAVYVSYNEETGSIYTWADPVTPDDLTCFFIYNTKTKEAFKPGDWSVVDVDSEKLKELLQQELNERMEMMKRMSPPAKGCGRTQCE